MNEPEPVKRWKEYDFERGFYPKGENDESDKAFLRTIGYPEDFKPTEQEAYELVTAFMEG